MTHVPLAVMKKYKYNYTIFKYKKNVMDLIKNKMILFFDAK